ncbi:MAG: hypothetical protein DRQ47_05190 [Gammaproteobacteria bacterium]|nr:MAG: hypothetical protein DRQ47_05190 [Gammaproteobacteria bacterium]
MSTDDQKPTGSLNELERIRDLLSDDPNIKQLVPVLNQSIPVLNEKVEIADEINISLDQENTTETIQEQLVRTHHEQPPAVFELVADQELEVPKMLEVPEEIVQEATDLILEEAWETVEMLLMNNLPAQLSGAFLNLLSNQITQNKQQLRDELSLLDEDSLLELVEALDIEHGF